MKVLKRICSTAIAIGLILTSGIVVKAVDRNETTSSVESAKQGVVQVNTVYLDNNSDKHLVTGGAGFIVGDTEGTEYVITCNHIVNPDRDIKQAAIDLYQSVDSTSEKKSSNDIDFTTEVVVEGDFVLNATVITASEDLDMAVLELPQPIYTKTPLKLYTNKSLEEIELPYAVGDEVYALGYPEAIDYLSTTKYYSDQQVQMDEGVITEFVDREGVQFVVSNAVTNMNNYGGPLVDKNGYVVGLNLPFHDGDNSCALDSTKISKVLDGFGITYSEAEESTTKPEIKLNNPNTVQTDEESNSAQQTTAVKSQKSKGLSETVIVVISLLAVFLVTCGVASLILSIVNKGKSADKKNKKIYEGPVFDFDILPENNVKITGANPSAETTILSDMPKVDIDETAVLNEESNTPQNLGTLTRRKTSEKVLVNKTDFIIGKDANHADFCIGNNSSISRKHAMITSGRNGVYIQDCNSTNGTYINSTKLECGRLVLLNDGDIVRLSNEEFEYSS